MLIYVIKGGRETIITKIKVFKNVKVVHCDSNTTVSTLHRKKIKVPSTHEKLLKASIIGAKIADLVLRSSNIHNHLTEKSNSWNLFLTPG